METTQTRIKGIWTTAQDGQPLMASNSRPYLKVGFDSGKTYVVFDEKLKALIKTLKVADAVIIRTEMKGQYDNLIGIELDKNPPAQSAANPMPNAKPAWDSWPTMIDVAIKLAQFQAVVSGNPKANSALATPEHIANLAHRLTELKEVKPTTPEMPISEEMIDSGKQM